MPRRPERPADAEYYERERVELLSQGDLFRDVPLAYPMPADELVVDEEGGGGRRFLSEDRRKVGRSIGSPWLPSCSERTHWSSA